MSADDPFIGEIIAFAGNFAPVGWALCNGQLLAISSNTALFSILGTQYGGDGKTNFALPDLQCRAAMGSGNGVGLTPRVNGEEDGAESVAVTVSSLPQHSHGLAAAATGDAPVPQGRLAAPSRSADPSYGGTSGADSVAMNPGAIGQTGGSQPHANLQPFQTVNYIICLQGVFPPRS